MGTSHPGKVSVIVPAYNREDFIRQTVDSVLGQTYPDVELIVVDDGSTDGTRAILMGYGGRIRLLQHPNEANRGQSASINLGLAHVTGEYVAILDSDDYWAPEKLEVLVKYLGDHPDVGVVYSNGHAVDETGAIRYPVFGPEHTEEGSPVRVLLDCYFQLPSNAVARRAVYQAAGQFDETLRAAQDHDMAVRVAEVTKVAYVDRFLWYYRRHGNSISARRALLRWRNGFLILEKARRRYPYPGSAVRRRAAVLHFRVAQCLLEERRLLAAARHLLLAGAYDPARALRVLSGREAVTGPH